MPIARPVSVLPKGTAFSRYVMALGRHRGDLVSAAEESARLWPDTIETSLALRSIVEAGDTSSLSALTNYGLTAEFLELSRGPSVVERLKGRMLSAPVRVLVPIESSVPSGSWIPEAGPTPVRALVLGSAQLDLTKCGIIVVLTMELLRSSSPPRKAW